MSRLIGVAATGLLAAAGATQNFIGHSYNAAVGAISRGSLGANAGEVMTRLDGDENAGWGTDVPGQRTIHSIACIVQDVNAQTPETFDVALYAENPSNPGYPDLATRTLFASAVPGPIGVGVAATLRVITPTVPVHVPIHGGGDVFVAIALPAAAAGDGLSVQVVLGFSPGAAFTTWDTPGLVQGGTPVPTPGPATSHFLSLVNGTLLYNSRRHCWLDVEHGGAGGVGLAITNQSSFVSSNNPAPAPWGPAPGTGDLLSGSAPDVVGNNPGRADDIAMQFFMSSLGTGRLVVFLIDYDFSATWAPEIPGAALLPNSTGATCLVDPQLFGASLTAGGEAWLVTPIPASLRPMLSGIVVKQQAIGFDAVGGVHASPCDAMHF